MHTHTYYGISCLLSYGKIVFTKWYIGQFLFIISFTFFWPSIQWQISFHPTPLTLIVICCFIVSLFVVSDANVSLLYSVSASSTLFQQADEWRYYNSIQPILKYSSTACKRFAFFNISVVSNWYLLCFCKASASASIIFYSCLWCQFKGQQD